MHLYRAAASFTMQDVKPLSTPLIEYDMVSTIEKIGRFPIHLWSIRDMDRAVEEICSKYLPETPEEETLILDLCPYFATLWPSARALGIFMSERKSQFSKLCGIEVGCGLGLPSILAALLGAQIHASDFHPDVGHWLEKNAALNRVKVPYLSWDWTQPELNPLPASGQYDFVLASDVLYESRHPKDLVAALTRLTRPGGKIYLSDPGRSYLDRALQEFESRGFSIARFLYEVEESSIIPGHRLEKKRSIQVFEISC
jgi:predicted nicotinamide N-methyase